MGVMHIYVGTYTALLAPGVKAKAAEAAGPRALWLLSSSWLGAIHSI